MLCPFLLFLSPIHSVGSSTSHALVIFWFMNIATLTHLYPHSTYWRHTTITHCFRWHHKLHIVSNYTHVIQLHIVSSYAYVIKLHIVYNFTDVIIWIILLHWRHKWRTLIALRSTKSNHWFQQPCFYYNLFLFFFADIYLSQYRLFEM